MVLGRALRAPKRLPRVVRRTRLAPQVAQVSSSTVDFTTASTQDPLSMGGTWTNNTQATGGNVAMNAQSSMRIIAAASGGINMAGGDSVGQDAPPAAADYLDSFAFLPGLSGNQRITATLYVDSGYSPSDNHEIELILGCTTSSGLHTWVECGWSIAGSRFMSVFFNAVPAGYELLSPTDSNWSLGYIPQNNDVWVAELNRSTGTIITKMNGNQVLSLTDSRFASSLGSGAGIASFRRTLAGTSAANRYGFKSVVIEAF